MTFTASFLEKRSEYNVEAIAELTAEISNKIVGGFTKEIILNISGKKRSKKPHDEEFH